MTPHEREIRNLRGQVERLTEQLEDARHEIRILKSEVTVGAKVEVATALHAGLPGLTRTLAWILGALHAAGGRPLTTEQLLREMPGKDADERNPKILSVRIYQLRQAIGREAIKNHFGVGYALTPAGAAACDAVLGKAQVA